MCMHTRHGKSVGEIMRKHNIDKNKLSASGLLHRYGQDQHGNFAVLWAFAAIPLMMAVSVAVDTGNMVRVTADLQSAADNAALAAVIPVTFNDGERKDFAEKVFFDNVGSNSKFEPNAQANATRERVEVRATGTVPSLMGGILGRDSNTISVVATAELTTSDVVCVLALDKNARHAITFEDSAVFFAPACSVQANSNHAEAILSASSTAPLASSFCSTGGSRGDFEPFIKNECTPINDPYANLEIPKAGNSCDDATQVRSRDWGNRWVKESELPKTASGDSVIPDESTMLPGIYCNGLTIDGRSVDLGPGVYHVWGDLVFTNNAQVTGDGVTFILKGTDNRLVIENGAQVKLRAPSTGLTAGLVFWQKHLDFIPYLFGRIPDSPDEVTATSEISSGAGLNLIGTAYFPDHELIISSDNRVASQSPATSFIARRIRFTERANMVVRVDHEQGGVPPLLPRSDESARLVK